MKKNMRSIFLFIVVVLTAVMCVPFESRAQKDVADETKLNVMMSIRESVSALEEPKEDAAVVRQLKEGELVLITKKVNDEWSQVLIDGKTAYVSSSKITEPPVNEALIKEMEERKVQDIADIEDFERQRKETIRARIWGMIIAVLIVAIFALGIISTIKASKDTEKENSKK